MTEIQTMVICVALVIVATAIVMGLYVLRDRLRSPNIGYIHVVDDNVDGEKYMFLVIEKGKEYNVVDGKEVRVKIVFDRPTRGKDPQ